ncbi:MAG: hypothetical protein WC864_07210, partial [Ilumatobacteraceae bacterium]
TVRQAAGEQALSGADGPIVDAYGGVGLLSTTLVDRKTPIVLIESNNSACADARMNLTGYNANVVRGSVEQWRAETAGLVIADPSRSGLGAATVARLVQTHAPRIVLISCDAVASARDTRLLRDAGYSCSRATVLDLFPHTPHVEVVSTFLLN